jgi:hypothetical protein
MELPEELAGALVPSGGSVIADLRFVREGDLLVAYSVRKNAPGEPPLKLGAIRAEALAGNQKRREVFIMLMMDVAFPGANPARAIVDVSVTGS